MSKKASLDDLNSLHSMVAKQLAGDLDDPKVLSMAIRFLKDNEITADILESESMMSLTESIKRIASESKETNYSVDDMLNKTH
jgi:hypothetical protein